MHKALIVDDNPTIRQVLRDILASHFPSMSITEAEEGKEILKLVDDLLPDLLFIDIKLPGENGLELTKKVKGRHADIVIVIFTANDLPEYRQAAFQCGANYFLSKSSTSVEEILELVESIITSRDALGPN